MKNLKLLNNIKLFIILFFLLLTFGSYSEEEPVDIWNTEIKQKTQEKAENKSFEEEDISQESIYKMQSQNEDELIIEESQTLKSNEVKIVGLFDPAENGLDINMWSNSNGDQILQLFKRINKIDLSQDATEILDILLVTNAYYPKLNITKEQFLEIKSDWLIKNSNLELIEDYLLKNQIINENPKLTKYLVDYYLSRSEVNKSCDIFSKIQSSIEDEYLSKFNIYCLINNKKVEEAQLLIDLKKELGFKDKFYESKLNYLLGYNKNPETSISEKTILDFHLSHRTNPEFKFEPTDSTSNQIWKYLSTSNLLDNIEDIEISSLDKIAIIEKATHERNYTEKELFELYKRFQFNINQLLNIKESSKVLPKIEARALMYQGILITSKIEKKLELMSELKSSFENDGLDNAFNKELIKFLSQIDLDLIPPNYVSFYEANIREEKSELTKIKINNKVIHQSKLINYFREKKSSKNINKDLKDLLKKIKKNKKYFFSKKDVIMIEALKSDGIDVPKKYDDFYEINENEMPSDIQLLINNDDMGVAMLRIVESIGQDELKDMDPDTIYFIISTLNQLDIDPIRNKILLKVLPLKV
tara:strand:- start:2068 stop:3831 length:1764 start_codon:yes stop_codon:yes gene_type:complete